MKYNVNNKHSNDMEEELLQILEDVKKGNISPKKARRKLLGLFSVIASFLRAGLHQANFFIFGWYYKRCGDHFRQWNFIKSVKLLIQNYEHGQLLLKNEETHNRNLTRDNDKMRKELSDIKIKMIATDGQIDWANEALGMNIKKDSEN